MNRIVWPMQVSLDGYMEGPNHDISWHRVDAELHQHFNDWMGSAGAFLSGRTTYDLMADYWPTADQNPDADPTEVEFAGIWRDTPKVVYSRTLDHADWNTTIVREVLPDDVRALQEQVDGDLVVGGSRVGSQFLRLGLVDEIRVYVHPVIIGRGTPMFHPQDVHIPLELVATRAFGNGVVLLQHRPGAADPG